MLPFAIMYRCVSMKLVRVILEGGKLGVDFTIRACDDLASGEDLEPKKCSIYIGR